MSAVPREFPSDAWLAAERELIAVRSLADVGAAARVFAVEVASALGADLVEVHLRGGERWLVVRASGEATELTSLDAASALPAHTNTRHSGLDHDGEHYGTALVLPLGADARFGKVLVAARAGTLRTDGGGPLSLMLVRLECALLRVWEASRTGYRARHLSFMAHEIKTPLAALVGYTQLIARAAGAGETGRREQAMLRQARRLQLHLEGVLDLSRLETGRYRLSPVRFDLARALRELIEDVVPLSERERVRVEIPVETFEVELDEPRVRLVLMALMRNALARSHGDCLLTVRLRPQPGGVRVEADDCGEVLDGPGIARIFARDVDGAPKLEGPGELRFIHDEGATMYLARVAVEQHGGRLSADPRQGAPGMRFTVELPRQIAAAPASPADIVA